MLKSALPRDGVSICQQEILEGPTSCIQITSVRVDNSSSERLGLSYSRDTGDQGSALSGPPRHRTSVSSPVKSAAPFLASNFIVESWSLGRVLYRWSTCRRFITKRHMMIEIKLIIVSHVRYPMHEQDVRLRECLARYQTRQQGLRK